MTKEPERVQLTVITQEIEDSDDLPGTLSSSGDGASAGGGESSEGEGDIEIEHVGDETTAGGVHGLLPTGNITFDVRRRTLINIYQRTILEEFYRCGMTSASLMLNHLHTAAAEKTGLDVTVVKNWIRNRRRPTAVKSAEKFAEKIAQGNLPPVPTIPNVPSLTSIGLPTSNLSLESVTSSSSTSQSGTLSNPVKTLAAHLLPEPKRMCTESVLSLSAQLPPHSQQPHHHPPPPPPQQQQQHTHHHQPPPPSHHQPVSVHHSTMTSSHQLHPSSSLSLPQTAALQVVTTSNSTTSSDSSTAGGGAVINTTDTSNGRTTSHSSLLVKVRVSGSGESDFVEVEVPSLSYSSLLKSVCEELEVAPHEITKIRKLPNVWVRKDKDVQRMKEGQELEVIVKSSASSNLTPLPITSILTVNPFSSLTSSANHAFSLITSAASIQPVQGAGSGHSLAAPRSDSDTSLLSALTNDSPVSMPELTNMGGASSNSNQVNGLH